MAGLASSSRTVALLANGLASTRFSKPGGGAAPFAAAGEGLAAAMGASRSSLKEGAGSGVAASLPLATPEPFLLTESRAGTPRASAAAASAACALSRTSAAAAREYSSAWCCTQQREGAGVSEPWRAVLPTTCSERGSHCEAEPQAGRQAAAVACGAPSSPHPSPRTEQRPGLLWCTPPRSCAPAEQPRLTSPREQRPSHQRSMAANAAPPRCTQRALACVPAPAPHHHTPLLPGWTAGPEQRGAAPPLRRSCHRLHSGLTSIWLALASSPSLPAAGVPAAWPRRHTLQGRRLAESRAAAAAAQTLPALAGHDAAAL